MILEKLQSLIADQLGVDGNTITMDTNFEEDLGVDSLDIVELSMALEEEFDIGEMSEEDLASKAVDGEDDTMETAATTLSEDEIFTDTEADIDGADAGNGQDSDMGDEDAGETVLTGSNSVSIDRAAELKLNREQTRAANKASLTEVINNAALTEGEKTAAVEELAKISDISERESACELLLQSKGFDEAVVSITDDSADVIVNMTEITDAQRAQIEDVVQRK